MGKHSQHRNHPGRQDEYSRHNRDSGVDPKDEQLLEPDRDAKDQTTLEEREARMNAHTDRDPQDDVRLAAFQPQDGAAQQ